MERENYHQYTSEELVARMVSSWFNKNWHFSSLDYVELAGRTATATPVFLFGAARLLVDSTGKAGGEVVSKVLSRA